MCSWLHLLLHHTILCHFPLRWDSPGRHRWTLQETISCLDSTAETNNRECVSDFSETAATPLLAPTRRWVKAWQISADRSTSTWPLPAPINVGGVSDLTGSGPQRCGEVRDFAAKMPNTIDADTQSPSPVMKRMLQRRGRPCLTWLRDA